MQSLYLYEAVLALSSPATSSLDSFRREISSYLPLLGLGIVFLIVGSVPFLIALSKGWSSLGEVLLKGTAPSGPLPPPPPPQPKTLHHRLRFLTPTLP
jgi:hypothetical protein